MFQVLHSSAGAGKTHALVKHYLLLALRGPDPAAYTHILALTFTNKAAGEMRERILQYLDALASGKDLKGSEADVLDSIATDAGIPPEEVRCRAQNVLGHMLHHWPQVAVHTIDAFTRRVVMPFARDLRLDHDLRMTTEEEYYRAKAVDLLLASAGNDAALTELLVTTCEQLLEEERSWRPDRPLLDLSVQLTKENALEHLAELRGMGHARFIAMYRAMRKRTDAFRDRMRTLGRTALVAIDKAGLQDKDLANGKGGFISYLRKLAVFDAWLEPNRNALKAVENDKWHSGSADASAKAALERLAPVLRSTVQQVEEMRDGEMTDHAIAMAVMRELMATGSLSSIEQRLEELKQEEGIAFFSDLTRKVVEVVQREPSPFIYERLGERYVHFLIDEFQDTSLMQWHALLPLVENALATGGSALLVGDAKQAIYRWRNGEARQFVMLPRIFRKGGLLRGDGFESALERAYVPSAPLASNYRSAESIIAFNNELTARLKLELDPQDQDVYHRHEQAIMRTEVGYVEVACFGKEEAPEVPPPWALMQQAVEDCLADGFLPGDIAVLVRAGAKGREASDHLRSKGWSVVSPDGLTLGGDAGVCAVVSLLAWLQRPIDERAAIAAQAMALLQAKGATVDPFADDQTPNNVLRKWRSEDPLIGTRLPLIPLICRIAGSIGLDPATDIFLMGLIDEAHGFAKTGGDDLPGFLEHWERIGRKRSIGGTPGTDAIQVMTVHKAKGLQFPVVILPEAGRSSRGGNGELIWIKPNIAMDAPPSALVQFRKPLSDMDVPEIIEEKRLAKLDDLDVLYVALTRPEQRLYVSVDATSKEPFIAAMREHLGIAEGEVWTAGKRETARIQRKKESTAMQLAPSAADGRRDLAIRREAPEGWDPADPDPYRSFGRTLHAILARVRTVSDLHEAVEIESAIWGLNAETSTAIELRLHAILSGPELAPFYGKGLVVHTETTLIDGQGHAVRPDRIVQDENGSRILDIKTGSPSERHDEQVRAYTKLLQAIEGHAVSGWLLYLKDGALIPVKA